MEIFSHGCVRRIVVHVAHAYYLDAGILLLHHHGMVVHDLAASVTKLVSALLSSRTRRKMGDINRKMLPVDRSMNHKDVAGTEIVPFLLRLDPVYRTALECEGNGLAFDEREDLRLIKESHIDASPVRTVIMDDLVIGLRNLRFHDKILEHKPVLYLGNSEQSMPCTVILLHGPYDLGHVLKLLLILCLSPFVLSLRKEFLVILGRIIVCIKQILKVIESYDIVLFALLGLNACTQDKQGRKNYQ